MKIIITQSQLRNIISEQSVVGAPNYGMSSEPISQIKKTTKTSVTKNKLPYQNFTNEDTEVFKRILSGIGAPINPETMGFMYAWRECESSLGGEEKYFCNNPFSTTWDSDPEKGIKPGSPKSTMYSRTNSSGVRSYKSLNTGINVTIKTILKNFPNIAEVLRTPNLNILNIAERVKDDLAHNRWGTGGNNVINKVNDYLKGKTPKPRPINRGNGCY